MSVKKIMIEYDIVSTTIPTLKEQLNNSLYNCEFVKLELDFTNVEMVDSVGLGCLISLYNNLAKDNKLLEIKNISNTLEELFSQIQMDRLFEIN